MKRTTADQDRFVAELSARRVPAPGAARHLVDDRALVLTRDEWVIVYRAVTLLGLSAGADRIPAAAIARQVEPLIKTT